MNRPPSHYTAVPQQAIFDFLYRAFTTAAVPDDKAHYLARCLVDNDLRGVFSHGSRQAGAYVDHFLEKRLTPAPEVKIVQESPTTALVDGDGGLGYYAAELLVRTLLPKAKALGVAAGAARNHGHIGAAGIYARVPLDDDLFCFVTSGHQLHLHTGGSFLRAGGGSPMAFALPTDQEPPFVLDFGATQDVYPGAPHFEEILELAPGAVLRSFGLGVVCQALGGFLCGVPMDPRTVERDWPGAYQGTFIVIVDLNHFLPVAQFKAEMDALSRQLRTMDPPGQFPGQPEWERMERYRRDGVPVDAGHAALLRELAERLGLAAPL